MRRFLKIVYISLGTFFLLLLVSASILVWIVFTPSRLTPITRNQAEKFIPYPAEIGQVELTLFSTFPQFGIRINNLSIISPGTGAPWDTLVTAGTITGVIDARAFMRDRQLSVQKFILSDGRINIFIDSLGRTNFDLFMAEPEGMEPSPERGWVLADLNNVEIKNYNFYYTDLATRMNSSITGLHARISGDFRDDRFSGALNLSKAHLNVTYDGHRYLDNSDIKVRIPSGGISLDRSQVILKDIYASVNDLGIQLTGSVRNGGDGNDILADLNFRLNNWEIKKALDLVPRAYLSEYGIASVSGIVSSYGNIRGVVNRPDLPFADINIEFDRGMLDYEGIPFGLTGMNGEIHIYLDPSDKNSSFLQARFIEAKTPYSNFRALGRINYLFSGMHVDFVADGDLLAGEFTPLIPSGMDLSVNGRIKGQVKGDLMITGNPGIVPGSVKLSGSALLSGFSISYDSIHIAADKANLDFSTPNPGPSAVSTGFAYLKISSDNLKASGPGGFSSYIKKGNFYAEMSDVRDTTMIPYLFCTFSNDSLAISMDTITFSINKPLGYFSLSPGQDDPASPALRAACNGFNLRAGIGHSSVFFEGIDLYTGIVSDNSREDVFSRWPAEGFLHIHNGTIIFPEISEQLGIPSVKMDFRPESFTLGESKFIFGQSDFSLEGGLTNVLSFFRGDSILRGDFNFESGKTDLAYLMAVTSGIGTETGQSGENPARENNFSPGDGPYMVPRGIDVSMRTDIRQAFFGPDTASNILGRIYINDGILLMDRLTFTTPAADMQLTAMYRTPRKNHLYLGLDYHLMNVEISRLLKMLPDLDTLMPMLRSFDGYGEFHLAVEAYLDSLYNVKKSTLRGASSIRGQNLVLMDNETFGEIARTLRFSRQAQNRVDSIAAEFTIFREEIDVYPFLMVMDRYKVVIGGRHNFDMSFDYHISLVESPLPVRMGVDITGNIEQMQYRPTLRPRYPEFYRPASRRAVESRQLEFRKMIREALLQNMRAVE
jgi:hypothetical protein